MEWTDKLKRDVYGVQRGFESAGGPVMIKVLIALLALVFILGIVMEASEVEADTGDVVRSITLQERSVKAQEDQARYLKKIASELHRMRIKMEK